MRPENDADHANYLSRRMAELDEHFRKNAHAYGLQEGIEKGEFIGRIHLAQRLLNQTPTPKQDLAEFSSEDLAKHADALEQQLLGDKTS